MTRPTNGEDGQWQTTGETTMGEAKRRAENGDTPKLPGGAQVGERVEFRLTAEQYAMASSVGVQVLGEALRGYIAHFSQCTRRGYLENGASIGAIANLAANALVAGEAYVALQAVAAANLAGDRVASKLDEKDDERRRAQPATEGDASESDTPVAEDPAIEVP